MDNYIDARARLLPNSSGKRERIVCLSGPIKIRLSVEDYDDIENARSDRHQLYQGLPEFAATSDPNNNTKIVQLSGPIRIILPVEQCEITNTVDSMESTASKNVIDPNSLSDQESFPSEKRLDRNNSDDILSAFCPYRAGNEILLMSGGKQVKAAIVKYFPATLSCCMVIRFIEPSIFDNSTSESVLKLYDRRFSTQHREDWDAAPWTPDLEEEYQTFIDEGHAQEFFSYWDAENERDTEWSAACVRNRERWSAAKLEAYLQWESTSTYKTERKAYEHMVSLQGTDVPKVFGEVVLHCATTSQNMDCGDADNSSCAAESGSDDNPHIIEIPGLLIQYINGFHLTDLHEHLPVEHWQSTVDAAIEALHRIQDCGILNGDVNTRSFMVDPVTRKVTMIDYGIVSFREDADDQREWERLQSCEDEEGAVGQVMLMYLQRRGGGYTYKPSERSHRLSWRFRMEGGENEGGTQEEDEYVKEHKDFVFTE